MASPSNSKYGHTVQGVLKMNSHRVVLFVVLAAVPVLAHHGGGYDEKTEVLTGTVSGSKFTNPISE
jgi:hypothetical protein